MKSGSNIWGQLGRILDHIQTLSKYDTQDVPATTRTRPPGRTYGGRMKPFLSATPSPSWPTRPTGEEVYFRVKQRSSNERPHFPWRRGDCPPGSRAESVGPDVARAFLDRAAAWDKSLKAFLSLNEASALAQADAVDKKIAQGGDPGALAGVPVAVKDNMCVAGTRTTCASKILENFTANYDATAVAKLRAAGAVFIGKTNLDEFAMGARPRRTRPSSPPKTPGSFPHPRGLLRGSASAVAARLAPLALGSDTGGSIRQPAALCGVVA